MEDTVKNICKNCSKELLGEYCYSCGQKIKAPLTVRKIILDTWNTITDIDKGFLYTTKMLFIAPEIVIGDYINGKTKPYYHPIRYLLIWASISVILNLYFGIFEKTSNEVTSLYGMDDNEVQMQQMQQFFEGAENFFSLMFVILVPFTAVASYLFYRKRSINYAEHLVLNAFFYGQQALIGCLILPMLVFVDANIYGGIMLVSMLLYGFYYAYVFKRFFKISIPRATITGLLTPILGMIFFYIFVFLLAIVVVLIFIAGSKLF